MMMLGHQERVFYKLSLLKQKTSSRVWKYFLGEKWSIFKRSFSSYREYFSEKFYLSTIPFFLIMKYKRDITIVAVATYRHLSEKVAIF